MTALNLAQASELLLNITHTTRPAGAIYWRNVRFLVTFPNNRIKSYVSDDRKTSLLKRSILTVT
jgi:hypothetical protein